MQTLESTSKLIKEVTQQNQTYLRLCPSKLMEEYYENGWIERNEGDTPKKVTIVVNETLGGEFHDLFVI